MLSVMFSIYFSPLFFRRVPPLQSLKAEMGALRKASPEQLQASARFITERMARCLQASLLYSAGKHDIADVSACCLIGYPGRLLELSCVLRDLVLSFPGPARLRYALVFVEPVQR